MKGLTGRLSRLIKWKQQGFSVYFIGVIGGNSVTREIYEIGYEVGREIAAGKGIVVCGGLYGIMEAACRGAKSKGGTTVGILPGKHKSAANDYVDIAVATGMGEARNAVIVNTADALIAIDGKEGTLSEIAFGLKQKKPVAGINTYDIKGIKKMEGPKQAVSEIFRLLEEKH